MERVTDREIEMIKSLRRAGFSVDEITEFTNRDHSPFAVMRASTYKSKSKFKGK